MKRLHAMMLGFNTLGMIEDAIKCFEANDEDRRPLTKTLVDAHYPEKTPAEAAARTAALAILAGQFGWNLVRPSKNRGVATNWNWVIGELDLVDGDVLFGMDPDGRPQEKGYLTAIMDIFDNAPEAFTVQLNRPCVYAQKRPHFERKIGQTMALDYHELVAWSLGAFDCGWIRKIGGMKQGHPLYGYTEHATAAACEDKGGKWYIARDFYDVHLKAEDPLYTEWKLQCAQHRTALQFADWLQGRDGPRN